MLAFPARSQDYASILDICVQRIARPNVQTTAQQAGQNNLAFCRNLGLHSKTILPYAQKRSKIPGELGWPTKGDPPMGDSTVLRFESQSETTSGWRAADRCSATV